MKPVILTYGVQSNISKVGGADEGDFSQSCDLLYKLEPPKTING
jgi:hypothetical protein